MTAADFRTELYDRYVSTFKTHSTPDTERNSEALRAWWSQKVLPLLDDVDRSAPVLELGCGSGNFLQLLMEQGFDDVIGVDLSEEMVALARDRRVPAECANAVEFLRTQSRSYEVIVALDFIEHFTKEELMEVVPLIRDSLKPGGRLVLQTPNGQGLFPNQVIYGDLTHITIFNPGSLRQLLQLFGFSNIAFFETGPVPASVAGVVRVALWRVIRQAAYAIRRIETGKKQTVWTENLLCVASKPGAAT